MDILFTGGGNCRTGSSGTGPASCHIEEPLLNRIAVATAQARERVVLVGLCRSRNGRDDTEADLAELARLTDTAGGIVVGRLRQDRPSHDPATLVGRGKADEIARTVKRLEADTVVFDDELSPAQIR